MAGMIDIGGRQIDPKAQLLDLDRADCEDSLYTFLQHAWKWMDASPFTPGWHIEAIAEHLQAVVDGDINRLMIHMPPRHGKSLMLSVAFPAWVWAQRISSHTSGPGVPFLYASYADRLSLRDSVKCRRLIESPWYQQLWGDRFKLSSDVNTKGRFSNDRSGERLITSIGAGVTGEGGNIICFPADEVIATEHGYRKIGDIVRQRQKIRVWSLNTRTGARELKPITGWFKNPASAIVRVSLSDGGSFRCTPDHHIWTERGYVKAKDLTSLDVLPSAPNLSFPNSSNGNFISFGVRLNRFFFGSNFFDNIICKLCLYVKIAPAVKIFFSARIISGNPSSSVTNSGYSASNHTIFFCKHKRIIAACKNILNRVRIKDCLRMIFASLEISRSMIVSVGSVFFKSSIFQILNTVVGSNAVKMAYAHPIFLGPNESKHNQLMRVSPKRRRFAFRSIMKRMASVAAPNDALENFSNAPLIRRFVSWVTGNRFPLFVNVVGHESSTFCLEVSDNHNFFVSNSHVVVSNCIDDPNAANDIESEATTEATIQWWTSALSTRTNDPDKSAIIIIQQRLAMNDLSGYIMDNEFEDWCHLCLPGRFEVGRTTANAIGWEDPRTEEGELLWPERFSEKSLQRLEKTMGPYVFAGQIQQRPTPKGGGILRDEWWLPWTVDQPLPVFDHIFATLDTAFTSDKMNDPSGICVWGIFSGGHAAQSSRLIGIDGRPMWNDRTYIESAPKVMLIDSWKARLELFELVERVAHTAKRFKVDLLIIENKASGISVAQEIRRLYSSGNFGVQLFDPRNQDKTARLYSVQHLFAEGLVFCWETEANRLVRDECSQYPKAAHDEYVDCTSMAMRYARDSGMLTRAPERLEQLDSLKQYPEKMLPLYNC